MKIVKVNGANIEIQKTIRWMDAEVFPTDFPVTFASGTIWFIGCEDEDIEYRFVGDPCCYAGWRPHYPMSSVGELHWAPPYGFLYRAGVLPHSRGKGFQKELIKVREDSMREMKIKKSITYTETFSIASMKSLMAAGYKPYEPTVYTNLAGEGRAKKFVHWEKDL